jgi:flavorubredoxin
MSMAELASILDGVKPVAVFLTHSELPHSSTLRTVSETWSGIQVDVSTIMLSYIELAPAVPIDQITNVKPDTTINFDGRDLILLDALLKDQPGSQWIYDPMTKILFSGDGFGYYHAPGKCHAFSGELAEGIQTEQFQAYHHSAFRFFRWVKAERFNSDLDRFFANLPVDRLSLYGRLGAQSS